MGDNNYQPFATPVRTPFYLPQTGNDVPRISKPWLDYLQGVARRAGRAASWRGDWDSGGQYFVGELVRHSGSIWIATQATPTTAGGDTAEPGIDGDKVWEYVLTPIPDDGKTDQVLTKKSDDNYAVEWKDATGGTPTFPAEDAHKVLAGPTSGSPAVPTFRLIAPTDLPIATTSDVGAVKADGTTVTVDVDGTIHAAGGGSGTVTNTGGALTADQPVFGAGGADIKVGTKSGNTDEVATVSGSLTVGHFLTVDASGNVVDGGSAPGGGSGSVTSVGLSMPAEFSVSGSPVTTSGTLTVTKANETAHTVFAGPSTGSPAAPTFRSLVAADIPTIPDSGISYANESANTVFAGPTTGSAATPAFRALVSADLPSTITTSSIGITVDGAGSTPTTGSKGFIQVPFGCTITGWTMLADVSGSAQFTVKKSTYSGFPSTTSIVASAQPNLSSAQKNTSTTLTGWTTTITAGDVLEFNLDSATTITRVILQLKATKA